MKQIPKTPQVLPKETTRRLMVSAAVFAAGRLMMKAAAKAMEKTMHDAQFAMHNSARSKQE